LLSQMGHRVLTLDHGQLKGTHDEA